MAKKLRDEDLNLNIVINGDKAKKELGDLEKVTRELTNRNKELRAEKDRLERAGKKETEQYKQISRQITENNKTIKGNETRMAALRKEIGITGLTMRQLRTEQTRLKRLMDNATPNTPQWKQYRAELQRVEAQMGKVRTRTTLMQRSFANIKNTVKGFLPIAGVAAFISVLRNAGRVVIEFEKAQSNLAAALETTKDQIKDLTNDAIRYGSITKFTASEVTSLQTEFAKLGLTQSQIQASTKATLDFAAATNAELGPAATAVGVALNAFNLSAANSERVASAMALATAKTALGFEDLQTILSTVGPVANAYNLSLEDTLALTGKLSDVGFDASSAATATRNILLNLADSNGKLAQALGRPIQSLDDLIPALNDLRAKGVDLNETLQLTDKRSVAAFNAFLTSADKTLVLRDGLIGVEEELQKMVDEQLDNMAGKLDLLNSAWQGFILSIEQGDGVIARFVKGSLQFLTDSLIKLSNIDLIFKRAGKFTADEVTRVYDAMLNLSGSKYRKFQELVEKENKLTIDQVILRKDAMIEEIRATGQSRKEAELLWQEFYNRQKEQSINAIRLKKEEEKKEEEKAANELLNQQKKADEKFMKQRAKALKIAELLEADRETQMAAIRAYFSEAGEGAFEAFMAAIEKEAQARDVSVALKFQKEEEETEDPTLDYAMQQYRESIDFKLALNESMYQQGLIGEQQYQHQLTELTRQAEEERLTIKKEKIKAAQDLAYLGANFVMALMDMELEKTGEDEEKKKAIKKKYADLNFAVTAAQIVANTAGAIMKGFEQLGPIAGAIAAGILGATGLVQLGFANAQRKKVKGLKSGGFTDRNSSDNEVVDFVHANEWVASAPAVRNPAVRKFIDIFDYNQRTGNIHRLDLNTILASLATGMTGRRTGGYTTTAGADSQSVPNTGAAGADFQSIPSIINELRESNRATVEAIKQLQISVAVETIERERNKYLKIQQTKGL